MSDYQPDYSRYYAEQTPHFDSKRLWLFDETIYRWPTSDGEGVIFRIDKRTEPFGPFITVYEIKNPLRRSR